MTFLAVDQQRRVWIRGFWGFDMSEASYVGFTHEGDRRTFLEQWQPNDLMLIYGTESEETEGQDRRQVLGFVEIEPREVTDIDRSTVAATAEKMRLGKGDSWKFAIPVKKAWFVQRRIDIRHVAPKTYAQSSGNHRRLAMHGAFLNSDEASNAVKLPVVPAPVYLEPPIDVEAPEQTMGAVLTSSRAITPRFGASTVTREDRSNIVYMMRLVADPGIVLGRPSFEVVGKAIIKVGYSNDVERRLDDLNSSLPPTAKLRWIVELRSRAFANATAAMKAEDDLKADFSSKFESLGREFFLVDMRRAPSVFGEAVRATAFQISV